MKLSSKRCWFQKVMIFQTVPVRVIGCNITSFSVRFLYNLFFCMFTFNQSVKKVSNFENIFICLFILLSSMVIRGTALLMFHR
jgi:hypothetical protein